MTALSEDRPSSIREYLQALLGDPRGPGSPAPEEYVSLALAVRRPADVAIHVEPNDGGRWTVVVCTADSLGALSVVAGLFAACRLDILRGEIRIQSVRAAIRRGP